MWCYKSACAIKSSHTAINEMAPHFSRLSTGNKFVETKYFKEIILQQINMKNILQQINMKNITSLNCLSAVQDLPGLCKLFLLVIFFYQAI